MKIEQGKLLKNRTWHYLMPTTWGFGEKFNAQFNSLAKYAVGLRDDLHKVDNDENLIYIMFDSEFKNLAWRGFIQWLRLQYYYVDDYPASTNISSRRQMVVLRVPEEFAGSYQKFIQGNYSEMFTPEERDRLFPNTDGEIYKVLIHHPDMIPFTKELLKDRFGELAATTYDFSIRELDLPLVRKDEIFNAYLSEGKTHYITDRQHLS